MPQRFRDPRRLSAMAVLGAVVALAAALPSYPVRPAKADPPVMGPAAWAAIDTRTISPDLARRALIRYATLCEPKRAGLVATGPLLQYANTGLLTGPLATVVACSLGAPADATCAQLRECTGEKPGEPAPDAPHCVGSGVLVERALEVGSPGASHRVRATESCLPQGAHCYERGGAAICAAAPCTPGETYACVPDGMSICTEGLRVTSPCPLGTACGASPGSGVLGCNGTGAACSDDSIRCDGTTRVTCLRDGFGKGREAAIDCASFGLACQATAGTGASALAVCGVDPSPACATESTAWTCEAGLLRACVAGRVYSYACADLGMAGVCQVTGAGPACVAP